MAAVWALRRLGFGPFASAAGAYLFAFGLPLVAQVVHTQLFPRFLVPPAVVFAWEYLRDPRTRKLGVVAACVVGQVYLSVYIGYFLGLLLATGFVIVALLFRRQLPWGELLPPSRREWKRRALVGVVAVAALLPLAVGHARGGISPCANRCGCSPRDPTRGSPHRERPLPGTHNRRSANGNSSRVRPRAARSRSRSFLRCARRGRRHALGCGRRRVRVAVARDWRHALRWRVAVRAGRARARRGEHPRRRPRGSGATLPGRGRGRVVRRCARRSRRTRRTLVRVPRRSAGSRARRRRSPVGRAGTGASGVVADALPVGTHPRRQKRISDAIRAHAAPALVYVFPSAAEDKRLGSLVVQLEAMRARKTSGCRA